MLGEKAIAGCFSVSCSEPNIRILHLENPKKGMAGRTMLLMITLTREISSTEINTHSK